MQDSKPHTSLKLGFGSGIGSENLAEFDGIPHLFSYPRCPQIDAHIERYHRTIQAEFLDTHLDIIHDKKLFHQALADHLILSNTNSVYNRERRNVANVPHL